MNKCKTDSTNKDIPSLIIEHELQNRSSKEKNRGLQFLLSEVSNQDDGQVSGLINEPVHNILLINSNPKTKHAS